MLSLLLARSSPAEIIIAGRREAADTRAMIDTVNRVYLPGKTVVLYPGGDPGLELGRLVPFVKDIRLAEKATAYLCRNFVCQAPVTDLDLLRVALETGGNTGGNS